MGRCEGREQKGKPGGAFLDKGRNSQGDGTLGVRCRQRTQRRSGDKLPWEGLGHFLRVRRDQGTVGPGNALEVSGFLLSIRP